MTEPSLAAQATAHELELLAAERACATGTPVAAAAFVNSDQALVCDVDVDAGEPGHEATVPLPSVRRIYP